MLGSQREYVVKID